MELLLLLQQIENLWKFPQVSGSLKGQCHCQVVSQVFRTVDLLNLALNS